MRSTFLRTNCIPIEQFSQRHKDILQSVELGVRLQCNPSFVSPTTNTHLPTTQSMKYEYWTLALRSSVYILVCTLHLFIYLTGWQRVLSQQTGFLISAVNECDFRSVSILWGQRTSRGLLHTVTTTQFLRLAGFATPFTKTN